MPETDTRDETLVRLAPPRRGERESSEYMARIDAGEADVAAMNSLSRRGVRVGNENLDADVHLHEMIPKPWGQEYRAYADDFLDVWHLQINPGHSTSMHAHPRKTTYLLCLSGTGMTRTLRGDRPCESGTVLRIGRGAFHATEATGADPLLIVEVETPRNKYDLVRLRDGYDRAGKPYEQVTSALVTASKNVPYLPNARMRKASPCGAYAFNILSGMDAHYRRHSAGAYLVPLGIAELVADQMDILTDRHDDHRKPNIDSYYLGIRRVG